MSLTDLRRRIERVEASRRTGNPTLVLTDRPIGDETDALCAAALANWRSWVAQGRAGLSGDVLVLTGPEMTEAEWIARHVTEH